MQLDATSGGLIASTFVVIFGWLVGKRKNNADAAEIITRTATVLVKQVRDDMSSLRDELLILRQQNATQAVEIRNNNNRIRTQEFEIKELKAHIKLLEAKVKN